MAPGVPLKEAADSVDAHTIRHELFRCGNALVTERLLALVPVAQDRIQNRLCAFQDPPGVPEEHRCPSPQDPEHDFGRRQIRPAPLARPTHNLVDAHSAAGGGIEQPLRWRWEHRFAHRLFADMCRVAASDGGQQRPRTLLAQPLAERSGGTHKRRHMARSASVPQTRHRPTKATIRRKPEHRTPVSGSRCPPRTYRIEVILPHGTWSLALGLAHLCGARPNTRPIAPTACSI